MGKLARGAGRRLRTWVQVGFTALSNGYVYGFAHGSIYKGPLKQFCLPGLNCYSCPGALGACPIGSLQAVLGAREYRFAFYAVGVLLFFGALLGRLVCGWLCPFGLVQDLLYKIPFVRKLKKLPGDRWLKQLKYVVLGGFVILLPLTVLDIVGQGQPWFCKAICPSGTLFAGIPLVGSNAALRGGLGWLFGWKIAVLAALLLLSIVVYRPFCRYLCPLGAVYGVLNPVALTRLCVDESRCTSCGACRKACPMDIPVYQTPNSPDCIRCGKCLHACPTGAVARACFRARDKARGGI